MRPTSQEINAKLAHLQVDSQDLLDQLAQNKYDIDKLQTQLEYLNSPVLVECLKLEFKDDNMANLFNETLCDDEAGAIVDVEVHGSAVFVAYTDKSAVYKTTESIIQMAEFMSGYVPTTLTEFDSKEMDKLRNRVREYVYGDVSDSESTQQPTI